MSHRQKDWPKQLAIVEFVVNNKAYSTTKVSTFMANYDRKLRIGMDIRKKRQVETIMEFTERMKKIQEEAGTVLRKVQKKMKQQADKRKREVKEWKKTMLSTKDLVFKERPAKKLVD